MIRHAVILGVRGDNGLNGIEKAKELRELLLGLEGRIPGLLNIEVGVNHTDAPDDNAELILICDFNSIEDCAMYQIHPAHVEVTKELAKYKTTRSCVDWEI